MYQRVKVMSMLILENQVHLKNLQSVVGKGSKMRARQWENVAESNQREAHVKELVEVILVEGELHQLV